MRKRNVRECPCKSARDSLRRDATIADSLKESGCSWARSRLETGVYFLYLLYLTEEVVNPLRHSRPTGAYYILHRGNKASERHRIDGGTSRLSFGNLATNGKNVNGETYIDSLKLKRFVIVAFS